MLYHYTFAECAEKIDREGVIKPARTDLYADIGATVIVDKTTPIVWLTLNPIIDETILAKLIAFREPSPGSLARYVIDPEAVPAERLNAYVKRLKMDRRAWLWSIVTAGMLGVDLDLWRVVEAPITREAWAGRDVATEFTPEGRIAWTPHTLTAGRPALVGGKGFATEWASDTEWPTGHHV